MGHRNEGSGSSAGHGRTTAALSPGGVGFGPGRPSPPRSEWIDRFGGGRVCDSPECSTRLSVYNPDPSCWMHQRPTPQPGRALRP